MANEFNMGQMLHRYEKPGPVIAVAKKPACEEFRVGHTGPSGMGLSSARPVTTHHMTKAKLNNAALVMNELFTGRMAVLEGHSSTHVYIEMHEEGILTPSWMASCDGSKAEWNVGGMPDEHSEDTWRSVAPFVAYALCTAPGFSETKQLFQQCFIDYLSVGWVNIANLLQFCDAFYYEWKREMGETATQTQYLSLDIVRQAIRTGNLTKIPSFIEMGIPEPDIFLESPIATEPTATAKSNAERFEDCKNGSYLLDVCWDLDQQTYIPSPTMLDRFEPNDQFFTMVDLINHELNTVMERTREGAYGVNAIGDNFVNMILVGKPGTGKTTLANALGATFGMPVRTVTVSKNAEEDLYQGMTKVVDGGFQFVETPFLDVYKNGGILLLEEFNLSDPAVMMGALGQAIVSPFVLYEDGYKEIHRNPFCVIISTMNVGTQGSREPSEAFTSRSPDTFMLDDPTEDAFIAILEKNGYDNFTCRRVYSAYQKVLNYLTGSSVNAEDVALSITMRHCLAALRQIKIGRPFKEALRNTIIGTIALKDLALAKATEEACIATLSD